MGPVGLLLATPLTVCLVVIGRHVQSLTFLEVILGDRPPLDAEETFYQRALEGNARVLGEQARVAVTGTSLVEYYDRVALRGLAWRRPICHATPWRSTGWKRCMPR